jgi:hypothetical protein
VHELAVAEVPDVRHLRVERLARGLRGRPVARFDQDGIAAADDPADVDGEPVEVLRDPREDAIDNRLGTDERPSGPVRELRDAVIRFATPSRPQWSIRRAHRRCRFRLQADRCRLRPLRRP